MTRWTRAIAKAATAVAIGPLLATACSPHAPEADIPWTRATPRQRTTEVSPPKPRELSVDYAGCATILLTEADEIECIYKPGSKLRLWVVHSDDQEPVIKAEGEGKWWPGPPSEILEFRDDVGKGYTIHLEGEGLTAVTVELPDLEPWRLKVRAWDLLTEEELAARNDFVAASIKLEEQLRDGDITALSTYEEQIFDAIEQGMIGEAVTSGIGASFWINFNLSRPDIAQSLLKKLQHTADRFAYGRMGISIYLAHTMRRRGQLLDAAAHYRKGARLARRLDKTPVLLDALPHYARVLADLGYFNAAAHWSNEAETLTRRTSKPYDRNLILALTATTGVRLEESSQAHGDPWPTFEETLQSGSHQEQGIRLELAELALLRGKPTSTLDILDGVSPRGFSADGAARIEALRIRALLLTQRPLDPEMLGRRLEQLRAAAFEARDPAHNWQTWVVGAEIEQALGDTEEALRLYRKAEIALDRLLPLASMGLPSDFTTARFARPTQELVSLLVSERLLDEAMCTVRQSVARTSRIATLHRNKDSNLRQELTSLITRYQDNLNQYEHLIENAATHLSQDEMGRTELTIREQRLKLDREASEVLLSHGTYLARPTCEQLEPAGKNELILALYPTGADLHVFAQSNTHTSYYCLKDYFLDESPGDILLQQIEDDLKSTKRVRVIASGRANSIAVHALPRNGQALALTTPVVYSLELPRTTKKNFSNRALVLADSLASKEATQEKNAVTAALKSAGWTVQSRGTRSTTAMEMRTELTAADLFHYAGHAYYSQIADLPPRPDHREDQLHLWPPYAAGAATEPSYIPIAEFGRLDAPTILMLEQVPAVVILMGCATGIVDERMAHGGFSLATAFLGAGSSAVLASTEAVDSGEAAILGRFLYSELSSESNLDLGQRMTDALKMATDRGFPPSSIASYRVFVP